MKRLRSKLGPALAAISLLSAAAGLAAPPKLTSLYPAGAARGASIAITAAGDFSSWPAKIWCDQPGAKFEPEKDKGKLKVSIAADAEPGVAWIRLYDAEGTSALRPFLIGSLPEAEETEPNDHPEKPQGVTLPVTLNGKLGKGGDVDAFAFDLKAGQTVVASLMANQVLGSPMDASLQICRLREPGVAGAAVERTEAVILEHNDDARGLDPQTTFTAPEAGRYLVRLFAFASEPGATIGFSGGDTFIYRLTITVGGFLDHPLPLALERGKGADLELRGWNLAGEWAQVKWPGMATNRSTALIYRPEVSGVWRLPLVEYPSLTAEPTASLANPQQIPMPAVISGEIAAPRETDAFRFSAKKGSSVRLRVESRGLGSPLDPVLSILDASGKTISEADDGAQGMRDPTITFAPPTDGEFTAALRDLNHQGGIRYFYRLSLQPTTPDFSLEAGESQAVAAGKTAEMAVAVQRQNSFAEPIEIRLEGLPEGVSATLVTSPPTGEEAKGVKLKIEAKENAAAWQGPIRIIGKSKGSMAIERQATFSAPGSFDLQTDIWLTVTPK